MIGWGSGQHLTELLDPKPHPRIHPFPPAGTSLWALDPDPSTGQLLLPPINQPLIDAMRPNVIRRLHWQSDPVQSNATTQKIIADGARYAYDELRDFSTPAFNWWRSLVWNQRPGNELWIAWPIFPPNDPTHLANCKALLRQIATKGPEVRIALEAFQIGAYGNRQEMQATSNNWLNVFVECGCVHKTALLFSLGDDYAQATATRRVEVAAFRPDPLATAGAIHDVWNRWKMLGALMPGWWGIGYASEASVRLYEDAVR